MPFTGRCPNRADCLLSFRNELITVPDDAPLLCPECKTALIPAPPAGSRTARKVIPLFILGGISGLVIMGAGAVYIQVMRLKQAAPAGQIGTSFEQAQIAAEHGEFLPSRHMPAIVASPTPDTSGTMDAGAQYEDPKPSPQPGS
jgi:hypothetical protein